VALTEVLGGILDDPAGARRLAEFGQCLRVGLRQTVPDLADATLVRIVDGSEALLRRHARRSPSSRP
jgi:hypothetical protein